MNPSFMRPSDIGRHGHQHFFFRQGNLLYLAIGKFKDHLACRDGAFDIFLGPFPIVGDGHRFNGVNRFPIDVSRFYTALKGICLNAGNIAKLIIKHTSKYFI